MRANIHVVCVFTDICQNISIFIWIFFSNYLCEKIKKNYDYTINYTKILNK